jgi:alkanesulfonate monooxygenase SsuD/methylene tetrahydromethanopterin reductase-like flavin-dependent oxidoreductase (luciferase family)
VFAERLGFEGVRASEHYFSGDARNPSPLTFLTRVAARTGRVRVGPYVLLPRRIAQGGALLEEMPSGT